MLDMFWMTRSHYWWGAKGDNKRRHAHWSRAAWTSRQALKSERSSSRVSFFGDHFIWWVRKYLRGNKIIYITSCFPWIFCFVFLLCCHRLRSKHSRTVMRSYAAITPECLMQTTEAFLSEHLCEPRLYDLYLSQPDSFPSPNKGLRSGNGSKAEADVAQYSSSN